MQEVIVWCKIWQNRKLLAKYRIYIHPRNQGRVVKIVPNESVGNKEMSNKGK